MPVPPDCCTCNKVAAAARVRESTPPMSDRPIKTELIARGLWVHSGRVLLCVNRKSGYCYLPGGHVEPGETITEALIREMDEEAGIRIEPGPAILIVEASFVQKGKPRHEINFVLHVQQTGADAGGAGIPTVVSREKDIDFRWASRAEMIGLDLRPACMKEWLLWRLGCDDHAAGETPEGFSKVLWTSDLR